MKRIFKTPFSLISFQHAREHDFNQCAKLMVLVISLLQPINPLATVVVSPRGRVSRDKICNIVTCLFPFVNEKKITGNSTKEKPCLANGKLIAAAPPPKPWKLQHMQLQHNPLFQL